MTDVSETESLEEITYLLLVTGQEGPQEFYFVISSPNQDELFSALRRVPILDQSDIEEIIKNENRTEFEEEGFYTFTRPLHDDILPYLSSIKGVEYHDLGPVSDANDFLTRAEQDINTYFQKYAQLLRASMGIAYSYETKNERSWAYWIKELKRAIPDSSYDFVQPPLEEIGFLIEKKGRNRNKLIAMQCRIIDALIKDNYAHAEEFAKVYQRMTLF